ncbi:MAG: hypothetical protein LBT40_09640 [Deltaproteobacteria bacterium]|nr:hypothetical protein [Deltaproteobacteria bacterium]
MPAALTAMFRARETGMRITPLCSITSIPMRMAYAAGPATADAGEACAGA